MKQMITAKVFVIREKIFVSKITYENYFFAKQEGN